MKTQLVRLQQKLQNLPAWLGSNWAVAASLGGLTIVILSMVLIFRHTSFFVNLDNVDQFYTWYQKLATSLHHGYLPVWDANVFGGQSFAGELQPGVFYPINWLWVLLFGSGQGISVFALDWLVALHFWLGAFGCYLLLKQMGARKWAALLGGVTFAFSGTVAFRAISQTVIFFGLCWIPYAIYFLLKQHQDGRRRWLVLSGVTLGMPLLVGHIDPFFFAFMAAVLVELAYVQRKFTSWRRLWQVSWPAIKRLFVVGIVAAIIALPQLIVSASYLGNSYRIQAGGYAGPGQKISYAEFSKAFNLDMHEFINLVDPVTYQIRDGNNIFIGLAPLAVIGLTWYLAAAKIRRTEQWKRHSFLVTSTLVFSVAAMLGYVTWFAVILYKLPVIYEIRQLGRYSIFFDLGLVMLLAFALPVLAQLQFTKRQRRNVLLLGVFLFIEGMYLLALRHHIFSIHFALQVTLLSLTLLSLVFLQGAALRKAALVVLILATAGVNTLWYLPKITAQTETPLRYKAMPAALVKTLQSSSGQYRLEIMNNAIPVNVGNVYNVQTVGGYSATVYAPYYNFMQKSGLPAAFRDDMLGVQLVADTTAPAGAQVLYKDHYVSVYKRPTALPKFFVSEVEGSVNRLDYRGLPVKTLHYDDRLQTFKVTLPQADYVIISEIDYPGWTATIDGKPTHINDYVFGKYDKNKYPLLKSLNMSAGTHTVTLTYKPFGLF